MFEIMEEDSDSTQQLLKQRLKNLFNTTAFCGLCLDIHNGVVDLDDTVYVCNGEKHEVSMRIVLDSLLGVDFLNHLASYQFCVTCKTNAINAYIFTLNAKRNFDIIQHYVTQLDTKTDDIYSGIQIMEPIEMSNAFIYVEDPVNEKVMLDTDIQITKYENEYDDHSIESEDNLYQSSNEDYENFRINKLQKKTVKTKSSRNFCCIYCPKVLLTRAGLRYHYIHRHAKDPKTIFPEIKLSYCPECETSDCRKHKKYLDHIVQERSEGNKRLSCIDCDYVCWSKQSLILHANRDHLKLYPIMCEHCAKPLPSKRSYYNHIRIFHSQNYVCKFCDRKLVTEKRHRYHEDMCGQIKRGHLCNLCPASFDSREKLIYHIKRHTSNFACTLCNKGFENERMLLKHISFHSKVTRQKRRNVYECSICHFSFLTMKERNGHMREEHDDHEKHVCLHCNMEFNTKYDYLKHENNSKHRENVDPLMKRKYKCNKCDYSSETCYTLEAHINRYHLKVAPYQCKQCSKTFTDAYKLKCHAKTHSAVKTHVCNLCGNKFCGPTALKKHLRLHTGERPYHCELCGDKFISSSVLNVHKMKAHSEKTIRCPLCDSLFHVLAHMRFHFRKTHWKSKEKFDIRKVEGLTEEQYDMFRDRRMLVLK